MPRTLSIFVQWAEQIGSSAATAREHPEPQGGRIRLPRDALVTVVLHEPVDPDSMAVRKAAFNLKFPLAPRDKIHV